MSAKKKNAPEKAPDNIQASQPPFQAAATSPVKDFFETNAKWVPLVAFGLLFLGALLIFKDFLFGEKCYLFKDIASDSLNFSYPTMYGTADYIAKYGLPKWSFSIGIGQSAFPFILRDPFDIFYYLAGKDSIQYGIIYKEFAKIVMAGMVFYYYLRKVNISTYTSVLGALFYSFSGFMILGSCWYIFTSEGLILALYLLAFEQLLKDGKWYLFPVAAFLTGISQPFNLYIFGLFLILYALLRLVQTDRFNTKEVISIFLKMAGFGAIGLLLAGPMLLENAVQLLESPRGGNFSLSEGLKATPMFQPSDKLEFGSAMLRFFSTDILGGGRDFRGWRNLLEAPMLYCGLPCLILMPQVFSFLNKRTKMAFAIFLGLWMLPMIFPYFRYAYWMFSGNYYRILSFFVSLVFMYFSLTALDLIIKNRKINLIVLAVTIVGLFLFLNYPYFEESGVVNVGQMGFVSVLMLAYGALLFLLTKRSDNTYIKYAFMALIFVEVIFMSRTLINDMDPLTPEDIQNRISYNDYTNEAVSYIHNVDKSPFYRVDKSFPSSPAVHGSINDALVQGYYGSANYSSFNQENYINYLTLMGISRIGDENSSRWAMGFIMRVMLEAQNNVKYIITKSKPLPLWYCDSLTSFNNIVVLRSKFSLPLGYTHDKYIKRSVFNNLDLTQKDLVSLDACVLNDADVAKCPGLKEFQLKDTIDARMFNPDLFAQKIAILRKDTLTMEKFSQTNIKGKINLAEDKMMYFSIPMDGGWKARVDGKEQDKIMLSGGLTGVMVPKGQHTVELAYELRYFSKGVYMSIAGLLIFAGLFFAFKPNKKQELAA